MKNQKYECSLFIFRRDLRLKDNTGLINALAQSKNVIPCFIIDPKQVATKNNYRSTNAMQFMIESIIDLDRQLHAKKAKLFILRGSPAIVIQKLIKQVNLDAVFVNRDYTPYSTKRDAAIKKTCTNAKIDFIITDDVLLNAPEAVYKKDRRPYTVFTPFFKRARTISVPQPINHIAGTFYTKPIAGSKTVATVQKLIKKPNKNIAVQGGRSNGEKILSTIHQYKNYEREHDIPSIDKTTHLSAHLKFGTVSIREAFHTIKNNLGQTHPLLRQLYWHDFFTHIAYHFPYVFGAPFRPQYKNIHWVNSKKHFNAWCSGTTGFPLIDAGMRQLNATGFMHNRVRMIVASFLVKDLHIDWRLGERYFATKLVDYDPAVNNGNWQWAASTGCDAQPYFRIFNPWTQQKRFDTQCMYIKKWVPELQHFSAKEIHALSNKRPLRLKYPKTIIDHAIEAKKSKQLFINAKT